MLERQRIRQIIEAAGEQLTGDWVLVGGALAARWLSSERVTEDSEADLSDCLALLDLARRGVLAVDASRALAHLGGLGEPPSGRAGARRARLREELAGL
jgi:hypothetical protein